MWLLTAWGTLESLQQHLLPVVQDITPRCNGVRRDTIVVAGQVYEEHQLHLVRVLMQKGIMPLPQVGRHRSHTALFQHMLRTYKCMLSHRMLPLNATGVIRLMEWIAQGVATRRQIPSSIQVLMWTEADMPPQACEHMFTAGAGETTLSLNWRRSHWTAISMPVRWFPRNQVGTQVTRRASIQVMPGDIGMMGCEGVVLCNGPASYDEAMVVKGGVELAQQRCFDVNEHRDAASIGIAASLLLPSHTTVRLPISFGAGDGFMCCVEVMATIHGHTFEELYGMLYEWARAFAHSGAYRNMMAAHRSILLGDDYIAPYDGYMEGGGEAYLPGAMMLVKQQIQALVRNEHPPEHKIWDRNWWKVAADRPNPDAPRFNRVAMVLKGGKRALNILKKLIDLHVLGMDALAFDHLAKWLQTEHGWTTDVCWMCLEDFSPNPGQPPESQHATWVRFGVLVVPPERRTGNPGWDWNIQHPWVTMHWQADMRNLGREKVVLMRNSHCRVVPMCTTLVAFPGEPQPPRHRHPRGRKPA